MDYPFVVYIIIVKFSSNFKFSPVITGACNNSLVPVKGYKQKHSTAKIEVLFSTLQCVSTFRWMNSIIAPALRNLQVLPMLTLPAVLSPPSRICLLPEVEKNGSRCWWSCDHIKVLVIIILESLFKKCLLDMAINPWPLTIFIIFTCHPLYVTCIFPIVTDSLYSVTMME